MKLTWHFEVAHEPDGTFVYERQEGKPGAIRWGPMAPETAGPFIDERKENLDAVCRNLIKTRFPALASGKEKP